LRSTVGPTWSSPGRPAAAAQPRRAEGLQETDPVLDAAVHQFEQFGHQFLHAGSVEVAVEGGAVLPALEDDERARLPFDVVGLVVDVSRVEA